MPTIGVSATYRRTRPLPSAEPLTAALDNALRAWRGGNPAAAWALVRGGGGRLLYVGLNSWIPADGCERATTYTRHTRGDDGVGHWVAVSISTRFGRSTTAARAGQLIM